MAEQTKPTAPPVDTREPHEIEFEKKRLLLMRVRSTRESMLQNLAVIEGKDPAKHYSWIHNSEARITNFKAQGFEICRDPKVTTRWRREDGTHVRGDLILMESPQDLHEAWKFEGELRAVEDLENSRDSFKAFAGNNKIPVTENPTLRVGGK